MKLKLLAGCLLVSLMSWGAGIKAEVNLGVSFDNEGLKSFYLAIGEHYQIQEKEVVVVKNRKVSDEEMPVVFYIARQAEVSPQTVIDLRLESRTWMEITTNFGLKADIYYVNVTAKTGPPYGKAYGYCRNMPQSEWRGLALSDSEIINFVNLRFVAEHYGLSPDSIVKLREEGKNYIVINDQIKKEKAEKDKKKKEFAADNKSKGKGQKNK